ncbi:MAG: universal stress protein [Isosphaeraceae bacterium]
MMSFRSILYPTDFSACSEAAIPMARALAREQGAKLVLLHIAPIEIIPDGAYVVPMDLDAYREALDELRRRLEGPDMKLAIETDIRQGDAADEILKAADAWRSDLIVMGTHGRTGLGRLVLGSVAEAVMRHANCPVLTIKNPTQPESAHAHGREQRHSILFF